MINYNSTDQSYISWTANPCPIDVHMKPIPPRSSYLLNEWLLLPPRSAAQDISCRLQLHALTYILTHPYAILICLRCNGMALVTRCSAIHFRGNSIRQVSYYTILSGFRLPWPPPWCEYEAWIWCVFQFERRVYHLRWQVLQICCTDCRIDETCARHATQCGVVPKTTLVMFIRND